MKVMDFVGEASEVKTVEELYELLKRVMNYECGYDRVLFSLGSDHVSLGLKAGHGIMQNYPDDWMKHYVEKGYEKYDPVRHFGFRSVGPYVWDDIPLVMDLSKKQKDCLYGGIEAGLNEGAAVCMRGVLGEFAGLAGARTTKDRVVTDAEKKYRLGVLNVVSAHFYTVFCSLHRRSYSLDEKEVVLTPKELEVLQLIAIGKTNEEISGGLEISKDAVDARVRAIFQKLNVSNRTAAVLKAAQSGLLQMREADIIRLDQRLFHEGSGRPRKVGT